MRSIGSKSLALLHACWPFVLLIAGALGTGFLLAVAQPGARYLALVQAAAAGGALVYGWHLGCRGGSSGWRPLLLSGVAVFLAMMLLELGQSAYGRFAPVAMTPAESEMSLRGRVHSVQPINRYAQRVVLDLHCALQAPCEVPEPFWRWWPRRVEIVVEPSMWSPVAGESWQLSGRPLEPPQVLPWAFPLHRFALVRHVQARFSVLAEPQRLQPASVNFLSARLSSWRERVRAQLLAGTPASSIVLALATGDRSALSMQQWNILQRTGTAHLMAISGLHIGLVCALVGSVSVLGLRRWRWLTNRFPAQHGALLLGLVAAAQYAALSGWGVPVQRAWLMLALAVLCYVTGFPRQLWRALQAAFIVIVCADPAVILSAGFWLSFLAVGFLLWQFGTQLLSSARWRTALAAQGMLTLALIPVSAHFFQQIPLASLGANLVAIPLVGLLVLPLVLVWLVTFLATGWDVGWLRAGCEQIIEGLMRALAGLASWDGWVWLIPAGAPWWLLLLGGAGVFWLLMPALPARGWGFVLLVPLLRWAPEHNGIWIYQNQQQIQLAVVTPERISFIVPAAFGALEPRGEVRRLLHYWGIAWPQRDLRVVAADAGWSSKGYRLVSLELATSWNARGHVRSVTFADPCDAAARPVEWRASENGSCRFHVGPVLVDSAPDAQLSMELRIHLPPSIEQRLMRANFVQIPW